MATFFFRYVKFLQKLNFSCGMAKGNFNKLFCVGEVFTLFKITWNFFKHISTKKLLICPLRLLSYTRCLFVHSSIYIQGRCDLFFNIVTPIQNRTLINQFVSSILWCMIVFNFLIQPSSNYWLTLVSDYTFNCGSSITNLVRYSE